MSFLDDLPLGTLLTIGGAILAFVAYLNNDMSALEALAVFGVTTVGAGQIGQARAQSGKGVRR